MQETQKNRVWPVLTEDVYSDLLKIASEERRKPSEMAAILIENAIKERKRKRKNAKEDSSTDNT